MKHTVRPATLLWIVAVAISATPSASANPGLLHKHGARPIGAPMALPGQAMGGGSAVTTSVAAGTAPSDAGMPAVAIVGPAVVGSDGLPLGATVVEGGPALQGGQGAFCMPAPDGPRPGHHGGPNVFHHPNPGAVGGEPGSVGPGIVDAGVVFVDGPPGGAEVGSGIAAPVDGAVAVPMVLSASFPPGGADGNAGGWWNHRATALPASASTADAGGRALVGGVPNQAAGIRTESLAAIRHHGRGPAPATAASGGTTDPAGGRVVRAGAASGKAEGSAPSQRRGTLTAASGAPVVPPATPAAPRWRDRLRWAWPTKP